MCRLGTVFQRKEDQDNSFETLKEEEGGQCCWDRVTEGEWKELRQRGDRGKSCGTLWAMVRTLTCTLSEMEPRESSEQSRALI